MNEFLTILTTGGSIALLGQFLAYFLFSPYGKHHKASLYRMAALFYFVLLLLTLIFLGGLLVRPDLVMDWQLNVAFNVQILPFIVFVVREILYPDRHVDAKMIIRHIAAPMTLLVGYLVSYLWAPALSPWWIGAIIVWGVVYLGVSLPRAFVHVRRYEALVREIFVDTEGRSLAWMTRLSVISFFFLLVYGVLILFDLDYLTTWVFNVLSIIVFMLWGYEISRMRSTDLIKDEQLDQEPELPAGGVGEAGALTQEEASEAETFMRALEEWLLKDEHLSSADLNREMVARAMGTNHVTLARMLRQQTGMTLTQYVTDLRLREAKRLLLETSLTVEEICYYVGFQTRSTFTRAFRERNNCTATEWREQHQK